MNASDIRPLRLAYWAHGFLIGTIFGIFAGFALFPIQAHAAVCAIETAGTNSNGNNAINYDGNAYAVSFTVASDCDVTDIKLNTVRLGSVGSLDSYSIWDSGGTLLVSGAATLSGASCGSVDSVVSAGTYTLTVAGGTYYAGIAYHAGASGSLGQRFCASNEGSHHMYYGPSPWTSFSNAYGNFEIDGADGGGGGGITATSTNHTIMRAETIQATAFSIMFAMLLYFAIKIFTPARRQRH